MPSILAETLRRLRTLAGVTLREVERATKVSNAYLSQLETGSTENPSPQVLHKLASYYEVPYEALMEAAGYLKKPVAGRPAGLGAAEVALMSAKLTEDEQERVAEFIDFLRSQRRRGKRGSEK